MSEILNVKDLKMRFETKTVFDDLGFALEKGSMTALLGPNGSGKTTLIRILMGMLPPTSGRVMIADNVQIGYVPQFRNLDPDYPLSIRAFVELNTPLFKSAAVKAKVDHILKETRLTSIQRTRMGEASGGQKQRAYLAQVLLDQPNFLILDEATASLDPVAKEELMQLIQHFNEKHHMTVLFTTHDVPLAKKYMKRYLLFDHQQLKSGPMSDLSEAVPFDV